MHHYRRNLGDYAKKTGRLSMLEHGAYNLLIDACYDRERFPTREEAIEWTWASTTEEIEAVEFVLRRFFALQDDGTYMQKRVAEEVALYHDHCDKQKENGRKGGRPRKAKPNENKPTGFSDKPKDKQGVSDGLPDKPKKTLTNNQLTNNQEPKENTCAELDSSPPSVIDDLVVIGLPTNKFGTEGQEFAVTASLVAEFQSPYPAVDVEQELRAMRAWLITNSTKRKTLSGMPKFVNSWLSREQNKGGRAAPAASPTRTRHTSIKDDLTDTSWAH